MTTPPQTERTTLAAFLLEQIAEDERVAREATAGPWVERYDTAWGPGPNDMVIRPDDAIGVEDLRHVIRHDPARVLADCEAKRRIVIHAEMAGGHGAQLALQHVLRFLALPYADRPGYDPEWGIE